MRSGYNINLCVVIRLTYQHFSRFSHLLPTALTDSANLFEGSTSRRLKWKLEPVCFLCLRKSFVFGSLWPSHSHSWSNTSSPTNLHAAILVTYQHLEMLKWCWFSHLLSTALTDSVDFYFCLKSETWRPFASFVWEKAPCLAAFGHNVICLFSG